MSETLLARLVLGLTLLPFLGFAARDEWLHWTARRPPVAERLLHVALAMVLTHVVSRAFLFDRAAVLAGLVAFVVLGGIDEFVFHRGLPASESDTHAKEHLALLAWLVVFQATVVLTGLTGRP